MAAEELDKMNVITKLSNQALQEYGGLQRKLETATMECKRMEEERDEAIKKLSEFHQVSQMVLEEVSTIQENLEIERTCRASAEALASKLSYQNRSLKRKSMMLLSHLSPETLTDINLEEEEDGEDLHAAREVCLSSQSTISELREKLESTLMEKNQAITNLVAVQDQLKTTRDELLKEKHCNSLLIAETLQQKKLLGKYNRVSQFAVEEYETLQDTLDLERDLRMEAENFARAMLVEQKKLKRQSLILMSSSSSQALQEALSQVARLTQDLETQTLEHQDQIKQMEDRLRSCDAQREVMALRRKLELVEEEKREYSDRCSKAEAEAKDMRFTVEELQKKLQAATNPPPAPAPLPPPPPPLPPAPAPTSNPLSSLLSLIRKRRDCTDIPLVVQDSAKTPDMDIKHQAVEEMMQRIKKGIQLRPVGQSSKGARRQMQRLPSNSAIQELKGIMENLNRNLPQPKAVSPTTKRDEELQRVLLKRREALESQTNASLQPVTLPEV
ncbi:shootin-1 [Channa argus]|uniref:shootin-1 n=1 Tax=Channa argus TaxID=215402 RepID=UPI003522C4F4